MVLGGAGAPRLGVAHFARGGKRLALGLGLGFLSGVSSGGSPLGPLGFVDMAALAALTALAGEDLGRLGRLSAEPGLPRAGQDLPQIVRFLFKAPMGKGGGGRTGARNEGIGGQHLKIFFKTRAFLAKIDLLVR